MNKPRELLSNSELASTLPGPIAVFGAGGFIGANVLRALSSCRDDAYGITQQVFVPWRLVDLPIRNILSCDINDEEGVTALIRKYKFQTILFFAAYGAYSKQTEVSLIYRTNVLGLLNTLTAATEVGVQSFIHAGSSSEYGINCQAPLEDSQLIPNSDYSVSKVSASYLIRYWSSSRGVPLINLRLYSVYGPWEEPDRLIPNVVKKGLKGEYPKFVDPEISRDFVYIDDVLQAVFMIAQSGQDKLQGQSVNIASGVKTTIRELAHCAKEVFGIKDEPAWNSMPNRMWDLNEWYGNSQEALKQFGWYAKTSLPEGLRKTADWFLENDTVSRQEATVSLQSTLRLSAIIACYKDGQAIPIMYKRLSTVFQQLGVDYEIIFVNDGSPDDSAEVLKQICKEDFRVIAIEHSRNFGSQSAFLSGMCASTGNAVVLLDGDLQDPPELIPEFFKKWLEGYDVVYGERIKREGSFFMQASFKMFYRVFRKLAYIRIPLDAGDFSLMDRKVVDRLIELPESDQFLRGLRAWVGYKQIGVPYLRPERMFGISTNNLRKNFWWARKAIFSFSHAPMEFIMYGGILFTGIALLGMCFTLLVWLTDSTIPRGLTTIVVLILFFGGMQMLTLSVLGEYTTKTLEEAKRRPKFIVRSIRQANRLYNSTAKVKKFMGNRKVPQEVDLSSYDE